MRRKKIDSINVVPFIDIMLVLLVIVLTTASFIQTGLIKVDLPKGNAKPIIKQKKELMITIDKTGIIYLDNQKVLFDNFESKLLAYDKDSVIKFYCDKNAKFNNFVNILNILKQNGYENLWIVTENE